MSEQAPEVMYAIRRTDGELVGGEYSFHTVDGPEDWTAAEEDAAWGDGAEYELVKMTVESVAVRRLPSCGLCDDPAEFWGLCEKHAREDDPDAFDAPDLAAVKEGR